ncbi:MAG TPA: hypothetical protein VF824_20665 [Thermoanaerobaculia bacterium]|jgi:hypothetical protein
MSDAPAGIGELRYDFVERNTALFLLLGILSVGERLERTVLSGGVRDGRPAAANTRLDYFTLGLIALTERISAMAAHFAQAVPEREASDEVPRVDGDLMR